MMNTTDKDDFKNDRKEETVWMEKGEWKKIVFHFGKVAFLMVYIYLYGKLFDIVCSQL